MCVVSIIYQKMVFKKLSGLNLKLSDRKEGKFHGKLLGNSECYSLKTQKKIKSGMCSHHM